MLTIIFSILFYFNVKLGRISAREKHEIFWATLFSGASLILLSVTPSVFLFFDFVPTGKYGPRFPDLDRALDQSTQYIELPLLFCIILSVILGLIFYVSAKTASRYGGRVQFIALIAGIATSNLLSWLFFIFLSSK